MISLARRAVSMLTAKRAVEAMLEHGRTVIELPLVESEQVLLAELAKAGFDAVPQAADHSKLAPEPPLARKSAWRRYPRVLTAYSATRLASSRPVCRSPSFGASSALASDGEVASAPVEPPR